MVFKILYLYDVSGILDGIFDGIQRPLNVIAQKTKGIYIPRGVNVTGTYT